MIDYVIRDCDHGEWLPIIVVTDTKKELYRGERARDPVIALFRARGVWEDSETGNIIEFKKENGLL